MKRITNWFRSFWKIATCNEAQAIGLTHFSNIHGDAINHYDCRSFWKDKFGIIFRCSELYRKPDYDWRTHGDFAKCYCKRLKRNYWVLGYFGGGSVNIFEAHELAKEFSKSINVPMTTVRIDEVLKSRRHKYFKFIYSDQPEQEQESGSKACEDVYIMLTD